MEWNGNYRVVVIHDNKPKMINRITDSFTDENNIENMVNKSRGDIAVTMLDFAQEPTKEALDKVQSIDGIVRVTLYK